MDLKPFYPGQVWWWKDPSEENKNNTRSSLQVGSRPVVVMNAVGFSFNRILIAPITSNISRDGVLVELERNKNGKILLDCIRPVFANELVAYLGQLDTEKMNEIFHAQDIYNGRVKATDDEMEMYFPNHREVRPTMFTSPIEPPIARHSSLIDIQAVTMIETGDNASHSQKVYTINLPDEDDIQQNATTKRKRTAIDVTQLTVDELKKFRDYGVGHICAHFGCCTATAYKKRAEALEELNARFISGRYNEKR